MNLIATQEKTHLSDHVAPNLVNNLEQIAYNLSDGEESHEDEVLLPLDPANGGRPDLFRALLSERSPSYYVFLTLVHGRNFVPKNVPYITGHIC